jgi:hypothetical protein
MNITKIQEQIDANRRSVAFDSYDITVKQMYDMILEGMIDIAPEYQRHFKWDVTRQSSLIESLLLGIPIPSLFMATNPDSSWAVIDGVQRLTTILNFIGDQTLLSKVNIKHTHLKLAGLEKLDAMNGVEYKNLPRSMQIMLQTRPLRVTVLNDRSDFNVRYDLFERLNKGGITLHEQEIRNCIYIGDFNNFIKELALDKSFRLMVKMTESAERNGSYEELVLRFFAYYEDRENFIHSVTDFLNKYMERKTKSLKNKAHLKKIFHDTFNTLRDHLPDGIVRGTRKNITPIVLYEAISVGCALALESGEQLRLETVEDLLNNQSLKQLTTGATNNKKMVLDRIALVEGSLKNAI